MAMKFSIVLPKQHFWPSETTNMPETVNTDGHREPYIGYPRAGL